MSKYRTGSHAKMRLTVHLAWVMKYRFQVFEGELQSHWRDAIRQDCNSMDIQIFKSVVGKEHVHLHI